ncbi:Glutathione S-transferase 1-1, partial [Zootermopsis nevadensis]
MSLDLYYVLPSPPCRAVMLLAKTLGLELNLKKTDLLAKEQLKPEFLKINPQHTVPTLVDDGFILWESHAILGYLVNQYGKDDSLYPKEPKKRAVIDQRLHFDTGVLFPRLAAFCTFVKEGKTPDADAAAKVEETFEFLNKFLEGRDWLAGSKITIADFAVVVNVSIMEV